MIIFFFILEKQPPHKGTKFMPEQTVILEICLPQSKNITIGVCNELEGTVLPKVKAVMNWFNDERQRKSDCS